MTSDISSVSDVMISALEGLHHVEGSERYKTWSYFAITIRGL